MLWISRFVAFSLLRMVMVVPSTRPLRMLIADDDSAFRETLRAIFEPHFVTLEAESGEEAIEIAESERLDIALLDMHMRVMTGLETLLVIRSVHLLLPCILITADATEELRMEATKAEAYSVLKKPVRKTELVLTVSAALEMPGDGEFSLSLN